VVSDRVMLSLGHILYHIVASEHGSPLGLDGQCVSHRFMSVSYMFLMLVVHVLIAFSWC